MLLATSLIRSKLLLTLYIAVYCGRQCRIYQEIAICFFIFVEKLEDKLVFR